MKAHVFTGHHQDNEKKTTIGKRHMQVIPLTDLYQITYYMDYGFISIMYEELLQLNN